MLLKVPRAGAGVPRCPALHRQAPCHLIRIFEAGSQQQPLLLRSMLVHGYGIHYDAMRNARVVGRQWRDGTRYRNDVDTAYEFEELLAKSQRPIKKYQFSTANSRMPFHLRSKGQKSLTRLRKKIGSDSPAVLLPKILDGSGKDFVANTTKHVASILSSRQAVILLQIIIRKRELRKSYPNWDILDALPSGDARRELIGLMAHWGYTRDELSYFIKVMETKDRLDQARLFLERNIEKPIFLTKYLLRERGRISDPKVLNGLIKYIRRHYTGERTFRKGDFQPHLHSPGRSQCTSLNMTWLEFSDIIKRLAMHCHLVDARLMVRLADVVAQYLQNMSKWDLDASKIFKNQCQVLNTALEAFRPLRKLAPNTFQPFAYIWEAQKALLSLSATFTKPLIISREGFRSIREVLSGLTKTEAEVHSSLRHAPVWPPYLRPADGMDEMMDPDESWSRTVQAGSMMQEAGYNYYQRDDVIDVLQGKDTHGSPTIQQLLTVPPRADTSLFEASIKATRNAKEAWSMFGKQRKAGMRPGPSEYAALLIKLMQRDAPEDTHLRPGDKALNFATADEPNLTDFERARSVVPSVENIFEQMQADEIAVDGLCLRLLMHGAPTIDDMHYYLERSATPVDQVCALKSSDPDPGALRSISLPLFAAYVHRCARQGGPDAAYHMARVIDHCRIRFDADASKGSSWVPYVWGGILRELGQHHRALLLSLTEQLELYLTILHQIETKANVPVSIVVQLCKNLRKTASRELVVSGYARELGQNGIPPHMSLLYDPWIKDGLGVDEEPVLSFADIRERRAIESEPGSPFSLYMLTAKRISQLLRSFAAEEDEQQRVLTRHSVDPISRMAARKDISRAPDAYEAMVALALLGEFEEMAWLAGRLAEQWRSPELFDAVQARIFPSQQADFMDTLCAFRLFAEPMLDEEDVAALRLQVEESSVLVWPTDFYVKDYRELNPDPAIKKLAAILERTRKRKNRTGDAEA